MKVGWHYLEDSDQAPPMPAATFLDVAGAGAGARSDDTLERIYFKGRPDPTEVAAKARRSPGRRRRKQILNEANLAIEQFGGTPADAAAFFAAVKNQAPGVPLYWGFPSPGLGGWQAWLDGAEMADGIAVHAYGTFAQMREIVEYTLTRFPGKPLWIAECNFGAGQVVDRDAWARHHFKPFLDWCGRHAQIEAVTYFAYKWPTPDSPTPVPVDGAGTQIETVLRSWRAPEAVPLPVQPPSLPVSPVPPLPPAPTGLRTHTEHGITLTIEPAPVQSGRGGSETRPYWAVESLDVLPPHETGGLHHLFVRVLDENGNRIVGAEVRHFWPSGSSAARTEEKPLGELGDVNWGLSGGWDPKSGPGPYGVEVLGLPSERITGMGLPMNQHTSYRAVFRRKRAAATPEEEPVDDFLNVLKAEFGPALEDLRHALIRRGESYGPIVPRDVVGVAVHNTGWNTTPETTWQQVAGYHVHTNGWNGIGYHVGIRRGRVAYLRDVTERGAHVKARNHELIGLVFAGDFEAGGAPSAADLDLGRRVIATIDRWLGRKVTVGPHGAWQAGGKACPGPALRQWCASIRADVPDPSPPEPGEGSGGLQAAVANAARGARILRLNGAAALQQRIAADGFWAVSGEVPVDLGERVFVGQLAEHPTTGELRVYYVERDRWERVLWGSIQ